MRNLNNAKFIDGDFVDGVETAGKSFEDATWLTANHCYVESVPKKKAGVRVQPLHVGDVFSVANAGDKEMVVYPPEGVEMNGLGVNVGVALEPGAACFGRLVTPTKIILT